jgi:hypothetical protein
MSALRWKIFWKVAMAQFMRMELWLHFSQIRMKRSMPWPPLENSETDFWKLLLSLDIQPHQHALHIL